VQRKTPSGASLPWRTNTTGGATTVTTANQAQTQQMGGRVVNNKMRSNHVLRPGGKLLHKEAQLCTEPCAHDELSNLC